MKTLSTINYLSRRSEAKADQPSTLLRQRLAWCGWFLLGAGLVLFCFWMGNNF